MPRKPATSYDFSDRPLGYRKPASTHHLALYPARALDVNPLQRAERPRYVMYPGGVRYDQGTEGACVGFTISGWCSAWDYNHIKRRSEYQAQWLYKTAKDYDEWPGNEYEGTSVNAGLSVLRNFGVPRLKNPGTRIFIDEYRWASSIDDVLDHIAFVGPVVFGTAWYTNFDTPVKHPLGKKQGYFIGEPDDLGSVRGGHSIMANGYYRDENGKEYVRFQNSWGFRYPLVWMPASTAKRLIDRREAEVALITSVPRIVTT